ncbi:pyrroloquinoline quinone biosynthesis peptide chaperone PqqD [Azospirillum sp. SYSU D00513]|uniref:pyrroloquinoline quinone biosynthesis peptide chaperone PqqD n=1 Tax=Azospirillum sp. SYSU D00513 TaxID=2812561 RepID=UPI001A95BBD8|nr:pyrroloquinoline quinone biosynthesis peptide chaperone PqqD [Azospirillum sp. SYSU D00513]
MSEAAPITEEANLRLAPGVMLRQDRTRGSWVLMAPERVLVLDEIALEVVRACAQGKASVSEGIDALSQSFDAPRSDITSDVLDLLTDLRNRGFLVS